MAKVHQTNDWFLTEDLATAQEPVLVLFENSEGWKQNATAVAFVAAAGKHEAPARFYRVDVDENPSVVETYHLKKLPTVALYLEGKEIERRSGSLDDRVILAMLARQKKGS